MEHLTKQNHDLEEQLRQRHTGHNTQEEDQEGTSADKRYQEGPEGSKALSRPERPDVSRPSITNMARPHIVAEVQMMREQMDLMMNALKGRVSSDLDDLVHRTDSPFTTFFALTTEVSYATGGKLRWKQGPFGSLGIFQDPNAPLGDTGQDHVQSLSHHVEGTRKDLVQQADA